MHSLKNDKHMIAFKAGIIRKYYVVDKPWQAVLMDYKSEWHSPYRMIVMDYTIHKHMTVMLIII